MHTNSPCRKVYVADPSAVYIDSNLSEKGGDHDVLYHTLPNKREKMPVITCLIDWCLQLSYFWLNPILFL